ncbi:hypothetical protein HanPI659440_Chr15g0589501 [Helianthus annuus]|nr:hypothetical protein HanPI659440_Chr15g0589501 [Helianthus annuus]
MSPIWDDKHFFGQYSNDSCGCLKPIWRILASLILTRMRRRSLWRSYCSKQTFARLERASANLSC